MAILTIPLDRHHEGARPTKQVRSDAAAASLVVTDKGCIMLTLVATNTGADGYAQVFDAAALPVDTTVPVMSFQVKAGETLQFDVPVALANGLVVGASSTAGTLTTAGTMLFWVSARIS